MSAKRTLPTQLRGSVLHLRRRVPLALTTKAILARASPSVSAKRTRKAVSRLNRLGPLLMRAAATRRGQFFCRVSFAVTGARILARGLRLVSAKGCWEASQLRTREVQARRGAGRGRNGGVIHRKMVMCPRSGRIRVGYPQVVLQGVVWGCAAAIASGAWESGRRRR